MAKVDFYVLSGNGDLARRQFACRLAEKAYRLKNTVHIQMANLQGAEQMDELLWTFRDGSFVPHEVLDASASESVSPLTIGIDCVRQGNCDLLINLTDSIPENLSSFPRVAEIVSSDSESRNASRIRFVEYRDDGHTLETHKL
jgi:DNA polymerase-3 subunit chi